MRHHHLLFLASWAAATPLLVGCPSDEELDACQAEFEPDDVEVTIESGDLTQTVVQAELQIEGSAISDLRLDRLLLGSIRADGTSSNFGQWSAQISPAVLEAYRVGEYASLPVVAVDLCGQEYPQDSICVRVNAPSTATATCLALRVEPSVPGECYVPVDGSAPATISLQSTVADAGVSVALSAAVDGDFLEDSEGLAVLRSPDAEPCAPAVASETAACVGSSSTVRFRPQAAGDLNIAAVSGQSVEIDESGLFAAAAPEFSGSSGSVRTGQQHPLQVFTDGRLKRCKVSRTTDEATVTLQGDPVSTVVEFDTADCGQSAVFGVRFTTDAPTGSQVTITCEDTYGQTGKVDLIATE